MKMFKPELYHIAYVNLSYRTDRNEGMIKELDRVGIKAQRFDARRTVESFWDMEPYKVMYKRSKGAIGCMLSQMSVMLHAYSNHKSAIIFEDDLIMATDLLKRLDYIQNFIETKEPDYDVIWLGGTVHINPPHWHTGTNPDLPNSNMGKDAEYIGDKHMFRSYGSFSTHAYAVNYKSIPTVLEKLNSIMHLSMGIDFSFIMLAPQMRNFVFLPGCIIQKDNVSDIGEGVTKFSGFAKLGPYWFTDKIEDFDIENYNFAECKM